MASPGFVRASGLIQPEDVVGNMSVMQRKMDGCVQTRKQLIEDWGDGEDLATRVGFPKQADLDVLKEDVDKILSDTERMGDVANSTQARAAPVMDSLRAMAAKGSVDFTAMAQRARADIAPIVLRLLPHVTNDLEGVLDRHPRLRDLIDTDLQCIQRCQSQLTQPDVDDAEMERLNGEVRELQGRLAQSDSTVGRLRNQILGLEQQARHDSTQTEHLETQLRDTTRQLERARQSAEKVQDKAAGLENRTAELEDQVASQKALAVRYLQESKIEAAKARAYQERTSIADSATNSMRQAMESVLNGLPAATTANDLLRAELLQQVADRKTEGERYRQELKAHIATTTATEATIAGLRDEISALQSRHDEDKSAMRTLRAVNSDLKQKTSTSKAAEADFRRQLRQIRDERDRKAREVENLASHVSEVEREWSENINSARDRHRSALAALRGAHDTELSRLNAMITDLQEGKRDVDKKNTQLTNLLVLRGHELAASRRDKKTASDDCHGLRAAYRTQAQELAQVTSSLDQASEALDKAGEALVTRDAQLDTYARLLSGHTDRIESMGILLESADEANLILSDQLRQLQLDRSTEDQAAAVRNAAVRTFLARLSGCAIDADVEGLLQAVVDEDPLAPTGEASLAPCWTIHESWDDPNQDETASPVAMFAPPPSTTVESSVMYLLGAAATTGGLASPHCHVVLWRLTEHVQRCAGIPVRLFSELARRMAAAVEGPDGSSSSYFETMLAMWQLMVLVDQRLRDQFPPSAPWHGLRDNLASYLEAHQYADVFSVVCGNTAPHDAESCRFFGHSTALCSRSHWDQTVVLDVAQRTLRFFDKSRLSFLADLMLEIQPPVGQPPIPLGKMRDGDLDWLLGV